MAELKTQFELELKEDVDQLGWSTFKLANETNVAATRGTAISGYGLLPIWWSGLFVDAAMKEAVLAKTCIQKTVPDKTEAAIFYKRKKFLGYDNWTGNSGETSGDLTSTALNTADSVEIVPEDYNPYVRIPYKALRQNALDITTYAREEMAEYIKELQEYLVRVQTMGLAHDTDSSTTGPTAMTNAANGCQNILGGDATMADDSLATGDIFTTRLVKKMKRMLKSEDGYYWSTTTAHTKSAVSKNPWKSSPSEPFVCFISSVQAEQLENETAFGNAAEYGSNDVVLNGEITKYAGIKFIETENVTSFEDANHMYENGTIYPLMNVDGHCVLMAKAQKYAGIAWAKKPTVKFWDHPSGAEVRLSTYVALAAEEIHPDAMVRCLCSDE